MGEIEIRVLGPVEAFADGAAIRLGGARQRTLLALLLLARGRAVAPERLADDLWHGDPPGGSATTLRSYVSRLRTALGADAVQGLHGGYAAAIPEAAIDAARFEALVDEGTAALARGSAGLAAERLSTALALWRGPAYADLRDCEPIESEARRLDELRLACLEARIEAELALGRHDAAIPELQALVRSEPLRERLWRQLVLALYRAGRQAEALAAYREARDLLDRELGIEPSDELRELERAILRQEVAVAVPPEGRSNLPLSPTQLIGRDDELRELAELLRASRLVTLRGLGGAGKTRLALEVARRQLDVWTDGVWLVDLTALADPALVPAIVAGVLEVGDAGEDRLTALVEQLRRRELLLVLDNCEHLVEACAGLVEALLATCPGVRVLTTSRVALGLPGEAEFAVEPLPLPAAIELFLERVGEVRRVAADGDGAAAERICSELEGLPLALELAAARANALSLPEIAERLDDRLRFLRSWRRIADPRHRTIETTMDWSYNLLDDDQQRLLRRLGVFAGGADLAAIAAVCLGGDEEQAVELLGRLVEASLVRAELAAPTRYRLLETVRQYAVTKLAEDPEADAVRRAHAEHHLDVADRTNLSIDALGRGRQDLETALREQHNLRAALDWAREHDVGLGLRLVLALENFWVTQAVAEAGARLDDLLARAAGVDPLVLAAAHRDRGAFADILGDVDLAERHYRRSRELFEAAGDVDGVGNLDFRLGLVAIWRDDPEEARRLFERSHATFSATGYRIGLIQTLSGLGELEIEHGDEQVGLRMIDEALEMAREAGWLWWESRALADRSAYAAARGWADEAEAKARPFLEFAWRTNNRQETIFGLAVLARAAALRGDDERARMLWATVEGSDGGVGRFGAFDRDEYAAAMPPGPLPPPLPLADAVALALRS